MLRPWRVVVPALLFAAACGTESTAPTLPNIAGPWRATLSLSGSVAADTFTCSGVLDLTLTQRDTVLSGTYLAPTSVSCMPTNFFAGGWLWSFDSPYTVAGIERASGDFRLAAAVYPDSLVFVGRGTADSVDGTASSTLRFINSSSASVDVPLTGTFTLRH
jgi:hypothetical protein